MASKDSKGRESRKDEKRRGDRVVGNGVTINCPDNKGTVIGQIDGDWTFQLGGDD